MYPSLSLPSRHIWNCHFPQRGGSWGLGWRGNQNAQTSKTCNTLTFFFFFCDQIMVGFAANFLHLSTTLWIGSGHPFTCIYSNSCRLDFSLRTREKWAEADRLFACPHISFHGVILGSLGGGGFSQIHSPQ